MRRCKVFVLLALLILVALPVTMRVHAITTAIGGFYGGCANFSVTLSVFGTEDDGNGMDRISYVIGDGSGKVLYAEQAWVKVGYEVGSTVVNMPYQQGATQNPIRFSVYNLDSGGGVKSEVGAVTYDAPCLTGVGNTTRSGVFQPPATFTGKQLATTIAYALPGSQPLPNITINQGGDYTLVYRSADSQWVAIFIGTPDLVWVPISTIIADPKVLTVPPNHIHGSGLSAGQNAPAVAAVTGPAPFSGQAVTRGSMNIRSAPNGSAATVGAVPRNASIQVLGRNASRTWLKINYNGIVGWVVTYYVRISRADVRSLPIVQ